MIIERDKADMNLYIARGEVFKRYIIAEGRSIEDAFTNYIIAATAWLKREKSNDK